MDYQYYRRIQGKIQNQVLVHWPTFRIVLAITSMNHAQSELRLVDFRDEDKNHLMSIPKGNYTVTRGFFEFSKYYTGPAEYYIQTSSSVAKFKTSADAFAFAETNGGQISKIVFDMR